jgi:feruloyl esterase
MTMIKMKSMLIAFAMLILLMVWSIPAFSAWTPPIVDYSAVATEANCKALKDYVDDLTDVAFNKPVTNVTATWTAATATTDSYCQVTGWIWPEIKFQVTMPTKWNERYQMNGGGGWDGSLRFTNSPHSQGYATSGANGGYMSANWPSLCGSFGLEEPYFSQYWNIDPDPTKWYPKATSSGYYAYPNAPSYVGQGNPDACQKVVDFGYRHLYETPVIAKKIVEHYYTKAPVKSYYSGGSCGGKEGQISAQKFPELYDGFFIGYPLGGHLAVTFRGTWDTFWGAGLAKQADPACVPGPGVSCPSVYAKYKAALHYKTVYDKCDAIDSLKDGLIDDPLKCKFDAMTDLPACNAAEEDAEAVGNYSSACFTLAQRQALKEIYVGPHNSMGNPWYPGQPLSAEYVTKSGSVGFSAALNDGMAPCMFANIALDPPLGPGFDIKKFNWDTDPIAMQQTTCQQCYSDGTCDTFNIHNTLDGITISPQPVFNMGGYEAVYKKGVKIVQNHGWSDALVTALAASRELYETTLQTMGVEKTKSFWKLYLVPGGGHGGGGLSAWPTNLSLFDAMVDWVENGNEPGALIGYRNANVDANYTAPRSRLSCPYPEVARWNGSDSSSIVNGITYTGSDNADNFSCVPPIEVRIEPETLNLKSKGEFSAFITVPEGYDIRDWNIANLTCEGAPAIKGMIAGNTYIAKFKRENLQNVKTGDAVTLTVKGTFTHDGKSAQIQASDMVRVIK